MRTVLSPRALQRQVESWRRERRTIGLVPTMGALHEGHLALVRAARRASDRVIVTIFVNPAQFGAGEDFTRYPRPHREDLRLLRRAGVDLVFTPAAHALYPPGFDTWVVPGELARDLEGASRPVHFRGVATICLKLFALARPHVAFFGRKDFQQAAIIRRMVTDLDLDLKLRVLPTVRDSDGLALSSRNRYLSDTERRIALNLPRVLGEQAQALREGQITPAEAGRRGRAALRRIRGLKLDYFVVREPVMLREPPPGARALVLLAAVRVGRTRLIDNLLLRLKFPSV